MLQSMRRAMQHCCLGPAAAGKMEKTSPCWLKCLKLLFLNKSWPWILCLSTVMLAPVTVAALGMHQQCVLLSMYCWKCLAELDKAVYPKELLVASWSFSLPCLAKLRADQDPAVPRLMSRGGRACSGMFWRQGCTDMEVSYQPGRGLCTHSHAPFTSWLSNGFWNWAHDTRECSLCVWANEQTSLNRMPGWRGIQTLISETLMSLPRLKEVYFFLPLLEKE